MARPGYQDEYEDQYSFAEEEFAEEAVYYEEEIVEEYYDEEDILVEMEAEVEAAEFYETVALGPVDFVRASPGFFMQGAILVMICLAVFLFSITANASYPAISSHSVVDEATAESASVSPAALAGQEEISSSVNAECTLSQSFPDGILQWCALITQYAQKHDLPPDLVAALILVESAGNPQAYSRSGAVGLMQVMPSDGLAAAFQCINGPCFADRPTTDQLWDPEFNIAFGTRMLDGLMRRYGNIRDALMSYGPKDVGYTYADKVLELFQRYAGKAE